MCKCVCVCMIWRPGLMLGYLLLWPFHFIYWRRVSQSNSELTDVVRQASMWGSHFCFPGICKADALTTEPYPSPISNCNGSSQISADAKLASAIPPFTGLLWAGTHASCKGAGCCQEETLGQEIALAVGKKGRQQAEKSFAEVNRSPPHGNSKQGLHRPMSKKLCVPEI